MQARFHAALWSPDTPGGLGPDTACARRFSVYRNNVQHGLCSALSRRFPVIERLVGAEFFVAMARVFAAAHPPENPVLITWGAAFPAFLARFPPVASLPYLPDVARLELARGRAYHAADAPTADPAALMAGDPSDLRLFLAPSVSAYSSRHPAVSIWAANQPGVTTRSLPAGPEFALIARDAAFEVPVLPLDPAQHAILVALLAGAPLGQAAAKTDPTSILALLLQHGLIAAIEGERS
jgi:hypothetical protein